MSETSYKENTTISKMMAEAKRLVQGCEQPTDCVEAVMPIMQQLLAMGESFLQERHFRSDPDQYARNAIMVGEAEEMSLYSLVWQPGQWTSIHDHGTWGVVGVYQGILEERNFIRVDNESKEAMENITLARGGITSLSPNSVTSFVPNPDHIHVTGNATQSPVVSLHLYGRDMSGFHIYDTEKKSRKWIDVYAH